MMRRLLTKLYVISLFMKRPLKAKGLIQSTLNSIGRKKVFVIGQNKTGTTSLEKAFKDLGFIVGDQRVAEILYDRHYFSSELADY